ncbi:acetate/propionate family kinase [Amorphus orientalis]|uniref:Acetate kinase n=1 Tax=Amorphus orientalis TaxID=649198 RepID=A0AAE3VQH0_9HYPH|nr:acetate/propionate family kinase [Amorphus orientalis]MDQ0315985.1 acetate kinase [Amorphus orientalis]
MSDVILTINAGSSSIKFSLFSSDALREIIRGQIDGLGTHPRLVARENGEKVVDTALEGETAPTDHTAGVAVILELLRERHPDYAVVAVGHRIVHGGPDFEAPVAIDDAVLDRLRAYNPLAPLHQPHNLSGVEAARKAFPDAVQVACFDTSFHRKHPWVNDTFALPKHFYDEGVRRYGFHGLSYEYIVARIHELGLAEDSHRLVVAHLGNGASMCAIQNGVSVASSMGFTALDGLPMGTRCGQIDPGVLLYLMTERGMSPDELTRLLYNESGLKGLSGISNDMRDLEASSSPDAAAALDYFVFRVRRELGALAAVLQGLDAVVLTGGIGENAAGVRHRILHDEDWLGISIDPERNAASKLRISTDASPVKVYVIPTNEEFMIARHTARIAADAPSPA